MSKQDEIIRIFEENGETFALRKSGKVEKIDLAERMIDYQLGGGKNKFENLQPKLLPNGRVDMSVPWAPGQYVSNRAYNEKVGHRYPRNNNIFYEKAFDDYKDRLIERANDHKNLGKALVSLLGVSGPNQPMLGQIGDVFSGLSVLDNMKNNIRENFYNENLLGTNVGLKTGDWSKFFVEAGNLAKEEKLDLVDYILEQNVNDFAKKHIIEQALPLVDDRMKLDYVPEELQTFGNFLRVLPGFSTPDLVDHLTGPTPFERLTEEYQKINLGIENRNSILEQLSPGYRYNGKRAFSKPNGEVVVIGASQEEQEYHSFGQRINRSKLVENATKNWHVPMAATYKPKDVENTKKWHPGMVFSDKKETAYKVVQAATKAQVEHNNAVKEGNALTEVAAEKTKTLADVMKVYQKPIKVEHSQNFNIADEILKQAEETDERRKTLAQSLTDDYLSNSEIFKEGQTAFEDFGKQLDETKKGIDEISTFEFPIDDAEIDASLARYKKKVEDEMGPSFGQQAAAFTRVFQDQMRSVFGDEATTMITNFTAMWAEQNGSWSEMWDENWAGMLSTGLLALDAIDGKQSKIIQGLAGGLGQLQALKAEAKMDWGNLFKQKGGEVTGIAISALGGMVGRDTQVGNALSGVGSGVAMGASFGPMGAFAGGVLGGLSSLMSFDSGPSPEEIAKEYAGKAGGRYGIDSALLEQVILKNSNNGENAWEAMYHPETLQVILSQLKEFGEKTQKMFAEDIAHGINIHIRKTGASTKEAFQELSPVIESSLGKILDLGEKIDPSMLSLINQAKDLGVEIDMSSDRFKSALLELMNSAKVTKEQLDNMQHNAGFFKADFGETFAHAFDDLVHNAIAAGKTIDEDILAKAKELHIKAKVTKNDFSEAFQAVISGARISGEKLKNLVELAGQLGKNFNKAFKKGVHDWAKDLSAQLVSNGKGFNYTKMTKNFKATFDEMIAEAEEAGISTEDLYQSTIDGINNTISGLKDNLSSVNDSILNGNNSLFSMHKQLWELTTKGIPEAKKALSDFADKKDPETGESLLQWEDLSSSDGKKYSGQAAVTALSERIQNLGKKDIYDDAGENVIRTRKKLIRWKDAKEMMDGASSPEAKAMILEMIERQNQKIMLENQIKNQREQIREARARKRLLKRQLDILKDWKSYVNGKDPEGEETADEKYTGGLIHNRRYYEIAERGPEFIMSNNALSRYGIDFMESVNSGSYVPAQAPIVKPVVGSNHGSNKLIARIEGGNRIVFDPEINGEKGEPITFEVVRDKIIPLLNKAHSHGY